MPLGILHGTKADPGHGAHNKDITHHSHYGGGGGGRKIQRTYLRRISGQQEHIRLLSQYAILVAGNHNDGNIGVHPSCQCNEFDDFPCFTRIGHQQQQIVILQNTQIAMLCFTGVQKNWREYP